MLIFAIYLASIFGSGVCFSSQRKSVFSICLFLEDKVFGICMLAFTNNVVQEDSFGYEKQLSWNESCPLTLEAPI